MKIQYQKYLKLQFCIQLNNYVWETIIYLQANPYRLKTKIINSLIFICTIIKYLMLIIFLCFIVLVFFKKEKKWVCCILMLFSTETLFKIKI